MLILIMISFTSLSQNDTLDISGIQNKVELLDSKVDQVVQNQLNYQIEKDLLKETYSNNYSRIQTIITIVLGLISILGFLGLNSINKTRKEYDNELDSLKNLKTDFEKEFEKFQNKVQSFEDRISELNTVNQQQEIKFKILEIREKVDSYMDLEDYLKALEYINVGLDLDPSNSYLKYLKGYIYFKLEKYRESIEIQRDLINENPSNPTYITDLAELYLLSSNPDSFIALKEEFPSELELDFNKPLTVYFDTLLNLIKKDHQKITANIQKIIKKLDDNEHREFSEWEFRDVQKFLNKTKSSKPKEEFEKFLNVFSGYWSKKDYLSNK